MAHSFLNHNQIQIGKPVESYRAGRKCKWRGCKQILSIYNKDTLCYQHQRERNKNEDQLPEVRHRSRKDKIAMSGSAKV